MTRNKLEVLLLITSLVLLVFPPAANSQIPPGSHIYAQAPYYANLLKNPNGENGTLDGWSTSIGWTVVAADRRNRESNGFLPPLTGGQREQVVDLLSLGFTPAFLDSQPSILISEIFEKRSCRAKFFLGIDLLDQNQSTIFSWSSGDLEHGRVDCDRNGYKERISRTLDRYGAGVRFIRWYDGSRGGMDDAPKIQNAYLTIKPANLLRNPNDSASWINTGAAPFVLKGPLDDREFWTVPLSSQPEQSPRFSRREQIVDLLALGFSASDLDAGTLPIIAEGTYRQVTCLEYSFEIDLLDANHSVLASQRLEHAYNIQFASGYADVAHMRFINYPAGTRLIRWADGNAKSGLCQVRLEEPYLAIVNAGAPEGVFNPSAGEGYSSDPVEYALDVSDDDESVAFATGEAPLVRVVAPRPIDSQVMAECDPLCKLEQIMQDFEDSNFERSMWRVDRNDDLAIFSSPKFPAGDLEKPGLELKAAIEAKVKRGKKYIDIATLDNIGPEWTQMLSGALKEVERSALGGSSNPIVRIHIGISHGGDSLPESLWDQSLDRILREVTSGLLGNSGMKVFISGGNRNIIERNWNHAKIVAVDGSFAVVGGHNLWSEYLVTAPVFDTSLAITGDSAMAAHIFLDQVWSEHTENFAGDWVRCFYRGDYTSFTFPNRCLEDLPSAEAALGNIPKTPRGLIQILGVGQTSTDHGSPLKKAVINMIDAAARSVYISQQMLTHVAIDLGIGPFQFDRVDDDIASGLAKRALADVSVHIVLSNRDTPWYTNSNRNNKDLLKYLWKAAVAKGAEDLPENRQRFCQNLKIAYLRIDDRAETYNDYNDYLQPGSWPILNVTPSMSFANHSKTIIIDKQVFLVGSHNLYPQNPGQLNEYSYVVANAAKAAEFFDTYWNPVWKNSARTAVKLQSCESAIDPMNIDQ